jgi:hypothetical protein
MAYNTINNYPSAHPSNSDGWQVLSHFDSSSQEMHCLYWKIALEDEPATWDYTGSTYTAGAMAVFRGVNGPYEVEHDYNDNSYTDPTMEAQAGDFEVSVHLGGYNGTITNLATLDELTRAAFIQYSNDCTVWIGYKNVVRPKETIGGHYYAFSSSFLCSAHTLRFRPLDWPRW